MLDDLLDAVVAKFSQWFGRGREPVPPPPKPAPGAARKPKIKQVFEGRPVALPEFAQGVDSAMIIEACKANAVCEYTPHIEQERIYSTIRRDMQGNLEIDYEGVAATCGAIKNFGMKVAQDEGLIQAYRYVDLNHIYRCCCGRPELCPFFQEASRERSTIDRQMRKLPEEEEEQAAQ